MHDGIESFIGKKNNEMKRKKITFDSVKKLAQS